MTASETTIHPPSSSHRETALWFGAFGSDSRPRQPLSPGAWTCIAATAIPLWCTWPALALWSLEMPAFECLTVAFGVGWLVMALVSRRAQPRGHATPSQEAVSQGAASHEAALHSAASQTPTPSTSSRMAKSWLPAVACALGLSGSNAFHILATHHIPAAEANLLSYLWPVEIVAAGAMLKLFRLRARQWIGLVLGLVGAVVLMSGGQLSFGSDGSFVGVGLAVLSGVSWAAYCVFRLKWGDRPARDALGTGFAISAVLCVALHFAMEPTVIPTVSALGAAAAVGVVPLAFGNFAWDEGFRRGDSQLLAILAYATPLCSALLLVTLGLQAMTWSLLAGAIIIVTAGMLSRAAG